MRTLLKGSFIFARKRASEWQSVIAMLGVAATIVVSPSSLEKGSFKYMLILGFTPFILGFLMGVTGLIRAWALILNGRGRPYGPRVRSMGALAASLLWLNMAYALVILTRETHTLSLGAWVYFVMAMGELYTCFRAGRDAWNEDDAPNENKSQTVNGDGSSANFY